MHIESWEHFDVFRVAKLVQGHVLAAVVFYALEHFDLIEKLDIPEEKLFNFLSVRPAAALRARACASRVRSLRTHAQAAVCHAGSAARHSIQAQARAAARVHRCSLTRSGSGLCGRP